ncbi:hypothetical protein EYF80_047658 [Liparis tanakae]|uniref:Uncharacterized protein n=1 Tax=Liparis tanakae TaxID=230148 RepID=A0A4Z2FMZ4_9TELE|nr:hypothetical protein EYF80_047658 [Liparis tanakae]
MDVQGFYLRAAPEKSAMARDSDWLLAPGIDRQSRDTGHPSPTPIVRSNSTTSASAVSRSTHPLSGGAAMSCLGIKDENLRREAPDVKAGVGRGVVTRGDPPRSVVHDDLVSDGDRKVFVLRGRGGASRCSLKIVNSNLREQLRVKIFVFRSSYKQRNSLVALDSELSARLPSSEHQEAARHEQAEERVLEQMEHKHKPQLTVSKLFPDRSLHSRLLRLHADRPPEVEQANGIVVYGGEFHCSSVVGVVQLHRRLQASRGDENFEGAAGRVGKVAFWSEADRRRRGEVPSDVDFGILGNADTRKYCVHHNVPEEGTAERDRKIVVPSEDDPVEVENKGATVSSFVAAARSSGVALHGGVPVAIEEQVDGRERFHVFQVSRRSKLDVPVPVERGAFLPRASTRVILPLTVASATLKFFTEQENKRNDDVPAAAVTATLLNTHASAPCRPTTPRLHSRRRRPKLSSPRPG